MTRKEFYRNALKNLGFVSTIQRAASIRIGKDDLRLTSPYLNHPVYARRNSTDIFVFDQIFVEREYSCLDELKGAINILDLGANCGFSSAYLLSRFPGSKVVSVEPDDGNFAMLVKNLDPYKDRALSLKGAVWSDCRKLFFDEATVGQGKEWSRRTREGEQTTDQGIQAWDMPTIIERGGFDRIDILKIDVEGAEENIFSAPDLSWISSVDNILIELHGASCERTFHDAIAGQGFSISRCGELTVCLR